MNAPGPLEQRWLYLASFMCPPDLEPEAVIKIRSVFYAGVLSYQEVMMEIQAFEDARDLASRDAIVSLVATEVNEQIAFRQKPDWTTGKPRKS